MKYPSFLKEGDKIVLTALSSGVSKKDTDRKQRYLKAISNLEKENITYLTISSSEISKIKNELDLKIILEEDNKIKFINNLSPDILIKKLSKYKIDKLLIEEISIEDLFIEYYK